MCLSIKARANDNEACSAYSRIHMHMNSPHVLIGTTVTKRLANGFGDENTEINVNNIDVLSIQHHYRIYLNCQTCLRHSCDNTQPESGIIGKKIRWIEAANRTTEHKRVYFIPWQRHTRKSAYLLKILTSNGVRLCHDKRWIMRVGKTHTHTNTSAQYIHIYTVRADSDRCEFVGSNTQTQQ